MNIVAHSMNMNEVVHEFESGNVSPLLPVGAVFIGMVHDELLIECPAEMGQSVARLLEQSMLDAAQPILEPIPVGVDVKFALSWGG